MLTDRDIELIRSARHSDPFAVLGVHADPTGRLWLRAMLPGAEHVAVLDATTGDLIGTLQRRHADGLFEGALTTTERPNYRLQVRWGDGSSAIVDDPYRFPPVSASSTCGCSAKARTAAHTKHSARRCG